MSLTTADMVLMIDFMQSEYLSGGVEAANCEEAVDGGYKGCHADVRNSDIGRDKELVV